MILTEKQKRRWVGIACALGLLIVFIFQRADVTSLLDSPASHLGRFYVNHTLRFLINDCLTIGLIYSLFGQRKYVIFSLWIQLAGMILFLLPYFALKFYYPYYNGPLISFMHRLIMNPTLLLLLIPAFYYQKNLSSGQH